MDHVEQDRPIDTFLNLSRISRRNAIALTIGGVAVVAVGVGGYYALLPREAMTDMSKEEPARPVPEKRRHARIAVQAEIATLSPIVIGMAADNGMVISHMYETPFRVAPDRDGVRRAFPNAALSFEPVGGNFRKMRMVLRKGIKFHNGDEFTADSLIHSVNLFNKPPSITVRWAPVTEMEKIDDYTVDLSYEKNNIANLLNMSTNFYFQFMHPSQEHEDMVADPIGLGPFKKTSFVPGTELRLEKVQDYWGDKLSGPDLTPYSQNRGNLDEVSFVTIKELSAAVTALRTGDVDVVAAVSLPTVAEVNELPTARTIPTGPLGWFFFHLNSLYTPLADVRVRQAVNHAIDRNGLLKLYIDLPEPVNTLIPKGFLGYDPSGEAGKNYPLDVARAKELMVEAGYKDGFDMELVGVRTSLDPQRFDATVAISPMLKEIGINAPAQVMEIGPWVRIVLRSQDHTKIHMWPFRQTFSFGVPDEPLALFERIVMPERQFAGIDHDDLIAVIDQARTSPNVEERDRLYREAQKIYMEKAIGVYYGFAVSFRGVSEQVVRLGTEQWPSETYLFPYMFNLK